MKMEAYPSPPTPIFKGAHTKDSEIIKEFIG